MTKEFENKIISEKKLLRRRLFERLQSLSENQRLEESRRIEERLFSLEEFKTAISIALFVSWDDEVNTEGMLDRCIHMGKVVGVPYVEKNKEDLLFFRITDRKAQLKIGTFGIYQPIPGDAEPIGYDEFDVVVVPGLAFDRAGNRLGRGKGYYDRFLKKLKKDVLTIGVCFDCQLVESLPVLPHDVPIKLLISGSSMVFF